MKKRPAHLATPPRALRLYAWAICLYPRPHRQTYGPLMLQALRDSYRDALATHGRIGLRFWLWVIGDEAKSLAREWGAALRAGTARWKRRRLAIAWGLLLAAGVVATLAACGR